MKGDFIFLSEESLQVRSREYTQQTLCLNYS